MTIWQFIKRDLVHFRKALLFLALGASLGAGVISAALLTGDSLRATLRAQATASLGQIQTVFGGDGLLYAETLENRAGEREEGTTGLLTFPVFANNLAAGKLHGVTSDFFKLAPTIAELPELPAGKVRINETAAKILNLRLGDWVSLVVTPQPTQFALAQPKQTTLQFQVVDILTAAQFGNFRLVNNPEPEPAFFADRRSLAERLDSEGKIHLLISRGAMADLRVGMVDLPLTATPLPDGRTLFKSDNFFIPEKFARAFPSQERSLAYLINRFTAGKHEVFYSFVLATNDTSISEGSIILSHPLAQRLDAKEGQQISLAYYSPDLTLYPEEFTARFTVQAVRDESEFASYRAYMPDIAGLTDVEDCTKWNLPVRIDFEKLTDADKARWETLGATPRALIPLSDAQRLWGGPFGTITGIIENPDLDFTPRDLGIPVTHPQRQFFANAAQGTDFGQLFLGLSFLVLVSASILVYSMQKLWLARRQHDATVMQQCGISQKITRRILAAETALAALVGTTAGAFALGPVLSRLVQKALEGIWNPLIGDVHMVFVLSASSMGIACGMGLLLSLVALLQWRRRN